MLNYSLGGAEVRVLALQSLAFSGVVGGEVGTADAAEGFGAICFFRFLDCKFMFAPTKST